MKFFATAICLFGAPMLSVFMPNQAYATPGDIEHCKTLASLIDGPTYVDMPPELSSLVGPMTYAELGLSAVDVGPVGGYIKSWVKYDCESKIGPWDGQRKSLEVQRKKKCGSFIIANGVKKCI